MTGEAESQRRVKPDPNNPQLMNGGFEEIIEREQGREQPSSWHYERQLTLARDSAPEGKQFARFRNEVPGRAAHALQGFAVNGRKVARLELAFWVKAENIRPGAQSDEWPRIVVTFYDERRAPVAEQAIGPFIGSFAWKEQTGTVRVPLRAREAIIRIGLLGAVGELSLDDLQLRPIATK
jgi:protein-L-isoaspartate(D-aspartate) O-methyltransferase